MPRKRVAAKPKKQVAFATLPKSDVPKSQRANGRLSAFHRSSQWDGALSAIEDADVAICLTHRSESELRKLLQKLTTVGNLRGVAVQGRTVDGKVYAWRDD